MNKDPKVEYGSLSLDELRKLTASAEGIRADGLCGRTFDFDWNAVQLMLKDAENTRVRLGSFADGFFAGMAAGRAEERERCKPLAEALRPFAAMARCNDEPSRLSCQRGTGLDTTRIFNRHWHVAKAVLTAYDEGCLL